MTSGRKYISSSTGTGKKIKSLQELEEHGEPMVKVSKVKSSMKVKVTKVMPTAKGVEDIPDYEESPSQSTRGRKKIKDKEKPMVH